MAVRINGIVWTIIFVYPYSDVLWNGETHTLGTTYLYDHVVYIADDLKGQKLFDVIFHELCHCFAYSYGFTMSEKQEECMCQIFEEFWDDISIMATNIVREI